MDEEDDDRDDGEDDEGATPHQAKIVDKIPDGWVMRSVAARKLNCHPNRIMQMGRRGEIESVQLRSNGQYYYDPDEIEGLISEEREMKAADLLTAAGSIINQQMKHTEAVTRMATETAAKLLEMQQQIIVELRERNKNLESQADLMKDKIDEAESTQFERDIHMKEIEASEQRRDLIQKQLAQLIPALMPIVMGFAAKMTGAGSQAAAESTVVASRSAVAAVLATLDEEQLLKFMTADFLTKEQKDLIGRVWAATRDGEPSSADVGALLSSLSEAQLMEIYQRNILTKEQLTSLMAIWQATKKAEEKMAPKQLEGAPMA